MSKVAVLSAWLILAWYYHMGWIGAVLAGLYMALLIVGALRRTMKQYRR